MQQVNEARKEFMIEARGDLPNLAIVSAVGPFVGPVRDGLGDHHELRRHRGDAGNKSCHRRAGIAEALAATSYGLAAAIPAAIGYNRLGATIARLDEDISDLIRTRTLEP